MSKHFCMALFLCLGVSLLTGAAARSAQAFEHHAEQLVFQKQDRRLYVNTLTLASTDEGVVSLWDRVVPRPGSAYHRKLQKDLRRAGVDYRHFAYYQTLTELDCPRDIHRELTTVYYDRNDRILLSTSARDYRWHEILPAQKESHLRNEICGRDALADTRQEFASVSMGCPEIAMTP